jgi:hypothetical protein
MLKKLKLHTKEWILNHKKGFLRARSHKRLIMCKKCYTFNYKNSWHFYKPQSLELDGGDDVSVRFTECPTCLQEEAASYEVNPIYI